MQKKFFLLFLFYILTIIIIYLSFRPFYFKESNNFILAKVILFVVLFVLLRQTIYISLAFFFDVYHYIRGLKFSNKKYYPLVSVIIPAWNEEKGIIGTIESVLKSTYNNLEIIIVNDGSTDKTHEIVLNFLDIFNKTNVTSKKILYIKQKNSGKGAALNSGIKKSSGEIIMTLDADSLIDKQAIEKAVEIFKDPKISAAAGYIQIGNTNTFFGLIQYFEYLISFMFKKADDILNSLYVVGGANAFFRREVFKKVGLFKTNTLTEDIEMSVRIQKKGMKITYLPDVLVTTEGAQTFSSLVKQRIRWRRGRYQVIFHLHKDLFFNRKIKQNKFLSWISLPYSVFMEITLFFEPFFLAFLLFFSFMSGNFLSFLLLIIVSSCFFIFAIFTSIKTDKKNILVFLYFPVAWMMYYSMSLIEYIALVKSLYGSFLGKEEKWQKWKRSGLVKQDIFSQKEKSNYYTKKTKIKTQKYVFYVLPIRTKYFQKALFKLLDDLNSSFFVREVFVTHKEKKYLNINYCCYEIFVSTKTEHGYFLFKNFLKNNYLFERLIWISSFFKHQQNYNFLKTKKQKAINSCNLCKNESLNKKKSLNKNFLFKDFIQNKILSSFIFLFLITLVFLFYFNIYVSNTKNIHTLLTIILFVMTTDGLMLFLNIFRRKKKNFINKNLKSNLKLVTCVIACYNGEKVIKKTLEQAKTKFSPEQIIVVSDKSTDKTAEIAKKMGVRVIENKINLNKAFSISKAVNHVKTPLVLIMDDDVYIKDLFIPTDLITEKKYRAVAFNVMPNKTGSLINKLQIFEYRKSMFFSKALRSKVGAVSNVSGAIGLFLKEDIDIQKSFHSGQFGGEDQQRTMLVHLLNKYKEKKNNGLVTFYPSTVHTDVPNSWKSLFKQRSFSWGMATHENLFLFFKSIFLPKAHFVLKVDRAYLIFIFLTEPLRMFLTPYLFLHTSVLFFLFLLYFILENISWIRTGRKDSYYIVVLSPFYNFFKLITRFIAYFYWFKVKYLYIKKDMHKLVLSRNLIKEYLVVLLIILMFFSFSFYLIIA